MYMISYGMNTNVESMRARAPTAVCLGKVTLPRHKLVFKYFADVEPSTNSIEAVLWSIDKAVLRAMDHCEGYPTFYQRKQVQVEYAGQYVTAWVYYMHADTEYCPPPAAYLNMITEGYASAGISLSSLELLDYSS